MKYKALSLDSFHIIGLSVRTNNRDGKAQKDIGKLWQDFFRKEISNKITNKLSDALYCIYTEYESDHTGDYTCYLGCLVSDNNKIEGLSSITISKANYLIFEEQGLAINSAAKIWDHIWQSNYKRNYIADFDVYQKNAFGEQESLLKTYISIK